MTDLEKIYLVEHYWELDRYISENIYELEDYRGTEIFQENVLKWGIIGTIIAALLAIIGVLIFGNKGGGYSSGGGGGSSSSSSSSAQNTAKANVIIGDYDKAIEEAKRKGDEAKAEQLEFRQAALGIFVTLQKYKNINQLFDNITSWDNISYNKNKTVQYLTNMKNTIENQTGTDKASSDELNLINKALGYFTKYIDRDHDLIIEWFKDDNDKIQRDRWTEFQTKIVTNIQSREFDYSQLVDQLKINPKRESNISVQASMNLINLLTDFKSYIKKDDKYIIDEGYKPLEISDNNNKIQVFNSIDFSKLEEDNQTEYINTQKNALDQLYVYPAFDATIILFYLALIAANIFVIYMDKYQNNNDPKIKEIVTKIKDSILNLINLITINNINTGAIINLYTQLLTPDNLSETEFTNKKPIIINMVKPNEKLPDIATIAKYKSFDFNKIFELATDNKYPQLNELNNLLTSNKINFDTLGQLVLKPNLDDQNDVKVFNQNIQVYCAPNTGLSTEELQSIHKLIKDYFIDGVEKDPDNLKLLMDDKILYPRIKTELDEYQQITTGHQRLQTRLKNLESSSQTTNIKTFIAKHMALFAIPRIKFGNEFNPNQVVGIDKAILDQNNRDALISLYNKINQVKKDDIDGQIRATATQIKLIDGLIVSINNCKTQLTEKINDIQKELDNVTKLKNSEENKNFLGLFKTGDKNIIEDSKEKITKYQQLIDGYGLESNINFKDLVKNLKDLLENKGETKDEIEQLLKKITPDILEKKYQELLAKKTELGTKYKQLVEKGKNLGINPTDVDAQVNNDIKSIIPTFKPVTKIEVNDLTSKSTNNNNLSNVEVPPNGDEGAGGEKSKESGKGKPLTPKPQEITSNTILQKLEANPSKIPEIFSKWLQGEDVKNLQNEIKRWESSTQNK